jgi:hypothetical protein
MSRIGQNFIMKEMSFLKRIRRPSWCMGTHHLFTGKCKRENPIFYLDNMTIILKPETVGYMGVFTRISTLQLRDGVGIRLAMASLGGSTLLLTNGGIDPVFARSCCRRTFRLRRRSDTSFTRVQLVFVGIATWGLGLCGLLSIHN